MQVLDDSTVVNGFRVFRNDYNVWVFGKAWTWCSNRDRLQWYELMCDFLFCLLAGNWLIDVVWFTGNCETILWMKLKLQYRSKYQFKPNKTNLPPLINFWTTHEQIKIYDILIESRQIENTHMQVRNPVCFSDFLR